MLKHILSILFLITLTEAYELEDILSFYSVILDVTYHNKSSFIKLNTAENFKIIKQDLYSQDKIEMSISIDVKGPKGAYSDNLKTDVKFK
jgi:hypothetical protein